MAERLFDLVWLDRVVDADSLREDRRGLPALRLLTLALTLVLASPALAQEEKSLTLAPSDPPPKPTLAENLKPKTIQGKTFMICIGVAKNSSWEALDLPGADEDAAKVCKAGEELGFQPFLIPAAKQSRTALLQELRRIGHKASAEKVKVMYLYTSAHGVEVNGDGYLIPSDAPHRDDLAVHQRATADDLKAVLNQHLVPLSNIMAALAHSAPLQIYALDQCRNDPYGFVDYGFKAYAASLQNPWGAGLALPTTPYGQNRYSSNQQKNFLGPEALAAGTGGRIVHYAVPSGQKAINDGIYAGALAHFLKQPGLTIEDVFALVGVEVAKANQQMPVMHKTTALVRHCPTSCPEGDTEIAPFFPATEPARAVVLTGKPTDYEVEGYPMLGVAPGSYTMGCTTGQVDCQGNDRPVTRIRIGQGFWAGQTEVPQWLFEQETDTNPSDKRCEDCPVTNVTWCDAVLFSNRLSERHKLQPAYTGVPDDAGFGDGCAWAAEVGWNLEAEGFRLPTEAEWELIARAGTDLPYSGSQHQARVSVLPPRRVRRVGSKASNAWNFYDLSGNAWEWCFDEYRWRLPGGKWLNFFAESDGDLHRVIRGGRLFYAANGSVSARNPQVAGLATGYIGFRVVRGAVLPAEQLTDEQLTDEQLTDEQLTDEQPAEGP